jgi:hypothetical protein
MGTYGEQLSDEAIAARNIDASGAAVGDYEGEEEEDEEDAMINQVVREDMGIDG